MDDKSNTTDSNDGIPGSGSGFSGPSVSITDELSSSYLDYAMSVIVSRKGVVACQKCFIESQKGVVAGQKSIIASQKSLVAS